MYRVDISADLNDDDGNGYLWAFLDEARDPSLVKAGAVLSGRQRGCCCDVRGDALGVR